ncbi:MAG TPA: hypothetical protein PK514_15085 [Spirochaetota bacterium]|nr:hypothetical protein [Spirochaetota bacterium]
MRSLWIPVFTGMTDSLPFAPSREAFFNPFSVYDVRRARMR